MAFWIALPVVLFGEALQMWAASHLVKQSHLTTSGPYSFVRNPMYTGRFFVGLGCVLMAWNPWVVAVYAWRSLRSTLAAVWPARRNVCPNSTAKTTGATGPPFADGSRASHPTRCRPLSRKLGEALQEPRAPRGTRPDRRPRGHIRLSSPSTPSRSGRSEANTAACSKHIQELLPPARFTTAWLHCMLGCYQSMFD